MKKLILTAVCMVGLSACNQPAKNTEKKPADERKAVGSDKDDHGCMASAGQTWSELKQNCIQVFNEGFRLNPVNAQNNAAVISAFVLMGDDQKKAELFLPDREDQQAVLLDKDSKGMYQNGQYSYDPIKSVLYVDGKEQYKGNVE
ncbi:hypothetical protein ODZ84_06155 [Chryseobacterium fluminis]|uniref:hypothetical protein n=1 Tax=Chryseobacterium fluminis TaxID=2983606 RepID=UPI002257B66E|nr:hypothetical protein [Chryseobacterium sp. MMS21-Ot14]UZT99150.1 hypothetical protein ODZ84_06155 [Chryseobacterium sp. MMS21-Ot14]